MLFRSCQGGQSKARNKGAVDPANEASRLRSCRPAFSRHDLPCAENESRSPSCRRTCSGNTRRLGPKIRALPGRSNHIRSTATCQRTMSLEQERPIGGLIRYIDNSARMLPTFNPAGTAFARAGASRALLYIPPALFIVGQISFFPLWSLYGDLFHRIRAGARRLAP